MVDPRMNLTQQVADEVRNHFVGKVYKTIIPRNVRLSEAPSHGKPILLYDVRSSGMSELPGAGAGVPASRASGGVERRGQHANERTPSGRRSAAGSAALIPGAQSQTRAADADPARLLRVRHRGRASVGGQPAPALRRAEAQRAGRVDSQPGAGAAAGGAAAQRRARAAASGSSPASGAGGRRSARGSRAIPVVVKDVQQREAYELTLVENLQREDLNPIEEAEAYQRLSATSSATRRSSWRSGSARTARRWPTRCACSSCRRRCATSSPAASCRWATRARCSASKPKPAIERAAARVVQKQLSVRQTEELVRRERGDVQGQEAERDAASRRRRRRAISSSKLERAFGTKVRLVQKTTRRPVRSKSTTTRSISSTRSSRSCSR